MTRRAENRSATSTGPRCAIVAQSDSTPQFARLDEVQGPGAAGSSVAGRHPWRRGDGRCGTHHVFYSRAARGGLGSVAWRPVHRWTTPKGQSVPQAGMMNRV